MCAQSGCSRPVRLLATRFCLVAVGLAAPGVGFTQASPFLTGATALQANLLAWLTPIAVILVMVLGAMAMASRIVENCGNTLVLRSSGSEHGGTSQFASRLIGQREVMRTTVSKSRRPASLLSATTRSQHVHIEPAVLDSEIEQLPDCEGFVKFASVPAWRRVRLSPERSVAERWPWADAASAGPLSTSRAAAVSTAKIRATEFER